MKKNSSPLTHRALPSDYLKSLLKLERTFHTFRKIITAAGLGCIIGSSAALADGIPQEKQTFEEYIRESIVPRQVIDQFLKGPSWARFDPELGFVQRNYLRHDAIDHSSAIYTFQSNGARTSFLYASKKPRINSYGDSFTECEQVNDGETWQEYLAGNIGEPIGNYGIGSYGVYQAYRRMIRNEGTDNGAKYLIFYIWGEDSTRSLMRCRYAQIYKWFKNISQYEGGRGFHGNFWPHLEMDLKTGRFIEMENPLPTPSSLYHMTEPQWMFDHLKDDLALQLAAYSGGDIRDLDRSKVNALAAWLHFNFDWSLESRTDLVPDPFSSSVQTITRMEAQVGELLNCYAQTATIYILEKARASVAKSNKKLLIVLFDPYRAMVQLRDGRRRNDEKVVEYLKKNGMDYFDMNEAQLLDFKKYKLSWDEYMHEYFIGHYNPHGNHLFAYAIRGQIVKWLEPKPITYQSPDADTLDFRGYLQGYR